MDTGQPSPPGGLKLWKDIQAYLRHPPLAALLRYRWGCLHDQDVAPNTDTVKHLFHETQSSVDTDASPTAERKAHEA